MITTVPLVNKPVEMSEYEFLELLRSEIERYKRDRKMYSLTLVWRLIKLFDEVQIKEDKWTTMLGLGPVRLQRKSSKS